ncbi:MAG: outer membrane protein assembly factor BamA [Phycisphaerales bacterium]
MTDRLPPNQTRSAVGAAPAFVRERSALPLAIVLSAGLGVSLAGVALGQDGSGGGAAGGAVGIPGGGPGSQGEALEGRVVAGVRIEGLKTVDETLVRNQIRTAVGQPLMLETVQGDVRRMQLLGQFAEISAAYLVQPDLSVVVEFRVREAPVVMSVDLVGNRQITDQAIAEVVRGSVSLIEGVPRDEFRINQARRAIEDLYRERGFYQVQVFVDESELETDNTIIFRIREGDRLRVTGIRFEGNDSVPETVLRPLLETKQANLLERGVLDEPTLDGDVAELLRAYRDRGFLDVRASRRVQIAPNNREAIVTFLIDEGPLYTLRDVEIVSGDIAREEALGAVRNGLVHFTPEQLRALLPAKPGDAFAVSEIEDAYERVRDAYRQLGFVDAQVVATQVRDLERARVDLRLSVREGRRFKTGLVVITGNTLTKSKVIRRQVAVAPDQWLDETGVRMTERRLRERQLFAVDPQLPTPAAKVQGENPAFPGYRDVLVEVEETNTGRLSFGAAVDSDAGLTGGILLTQRNFDLADTPESFDEFFRGRSFRGAGQTFNLSLQPGTQVSTYSISISEPSLFETQYGASGAVYYREREFDEFEEERYGTRLRLGRRFGTQWQGGVSVRFDSVELGNIDASAPVDIFEVEDRNLLTGLGFDLTRTTVDDFFRPTRGTRTELSVEQVGLLGGDFDYTSLNAEHTFFLPILEDVLGRTTVLSFKTASSWVPQEGEVPIYERFNLGGRTFRGFDFRGIGPVGIRNDTGLPGDDQVGGQWMFFFGTQVERPVWRDLISVVGFVDTGTVEEDIDFSNYRVSAGFGLRFYIPQLGQAPLAFDFGFPLVKESTDEEEIFSFSLALPF